mmetsp:Transcript_8398/g.16724  ORF Transcript_8398/g.16724 Transcript_8398/m.16724 type:complete len:611 (-) Transcript_8398:7795-9627(-)
MEQSKLPFLPGYSFRDPTKTNYHRQQIFGVVSGHQTESTKALEENVTIDEMTRVLTTGTPPLAYRTQDSRTRTPLNKSIPANPPVWLKYDRKVLRFMGFFQEPVVESPNEAFRVRKCVILHYLNDGTTYVSEPKVENSGIPQGVLIKQHVIPKSDGSGNYTWKDFNIGINLDFYGKLFRVVDCDEATRDFLEEQGTTLNEPERYPDDGFGYTRMMVNYKRDPEDAGEVREYIEVNLGGGHPNRNLKSFIANDRKVLSFDVMWDDRSYDGGQKFFKMNFYLSDSTIEVNELKQVNTGCDPFPKLLRRQKLPKDPVITHCPALSLRKEDYYQPEDLLLRSTIKVYGRDILIYDCDAFTKQWYLENLGIEVKPLSIARPRPYLPKNPIPDYNGYGTEEDSLGNCLKLQPNPPKLDMYKMFDNDQHVLRFEAKLISQSHEDDIRKFIVAFYPSDDTVKVFEVVDRNSGIVGGKFLERRKYKSPFTQMYYQDTDFLIGNTICITENRFLLVDADEYTHTYMENAPDKFPQASYANVLRKIQVKDSAFGGRTKLAIRFLAAFPESAGKLVPYKEVLAGLKTLGITLTFQEQSALLRRWNKGEYIVNLEEIYQAIIG